MWQFSANSGNILQHRQFFAKFCNRRLLPCGSNRRLHNFAENCRVLQNIAAFCKKMHDLAEDCKPPMERGSRVWGWSGSAEIDVPLTYFSGVLPALPLAGFLLFSPHVVWRDPGLGDLHSLDLHAPGSPCRAICVR